MQRLSELIEKVSEIEGISVDIMLKHRTNRTVLCKHIISWLSIKVYEYEPHIVASALGYSATRNLIRQACKTIENDIYMLNPHTLYILTEILCKEEKTTKEKTGGICSPSVLYNMLLKSLPSELQNTLRIHGNMSKMAMTDTKQPYSDTLSSTRAEKSMTKKVDSPTSPTQHGTRSFLYTSDMNWANREAMRYDYATPEEQRLIYTALLSACVWGRKCDYENKKRMEELKGLPNTVYISMID